MVPENDKIKSPTTHHKNVGNLMSDFPVVINQRRRARAAGDERGHFRFVVFQQRRERCRCCHDVTRVSLSLSRSFYDRKEDDFIWIFLLHKQKREEDGGGWRRSPLLVKEEEEGLL